MCDNVFVRWFALCIVVFFANDVLTFRSVADPGVVGPALFGDEGIDFALLIVADMDVVASEFLGDDDDDLAFLTFVDIRCGVGTSWRCGQRFGIFGCRRHGRCGVGISWR